MNTVVRKVVYTTLVGTIFGVLPLSLQAEVIPKRGPATFSAYDINKNGVITRKEFDRFRALRLRERAKLGLPMRNVQNAPGFNFFDANGNGRITRREFANAQRAIMQQRRGPMMGEPPVPAPMVNKAQQRGPATFSAYDINKNGVITRKEFDRFRALRLRERAKLGLPMRNAQNAPGFNFFDANGDGRITRREFANAQRARIRMQQRAGPMMGNAPMGQGQMRGPMMGDGPMGKGPNR